MSAHLSSRRRPVTRRRGTRLHLEVLEDRLPLAGALDHTFAVTGKVTVGFAPRSDNQGNAVAVAPQAGSAFFLRR